MPGNKARRNARSSRATHKTQLGVFRAFREARVSVFADKNEASFAGLVVLAGEFHPIPFRTRPLKPPAPMVLRLKPRESRSLPVQPRTFRLVSREHARARFAKTPPSQRKQKAPREKSREAFLSAIGALSHASCLAVRQHHFGLRKRNAN